MNKCVGCGVELQSDDKNKIGYAENSYQTLCERCFRIKHYNEYQSIDEEVIDFDEILNSINKTNDLVVLVIDVLNMGSNLNIIKEHLNNDTIIVLNKRDVLPKSISDEKLLDYINYLDIPYIDKIVISAKSNYNMDNLYQMINTYKKSKNVYIVGLTNAGKSTIVNRLIDNYSDSKLEVTTSMLPSTTIYNIEVNLNKDLTIIDTPGIIDEHSMINQVDYETMKDINPKKPIKPYSHQAKPNQYLVVENLLVILTKDNCNMTLFMSNKLKITKKYFQITLPNMAVYSFNVKAGDDIVINGLGFIKITCDTVVTITTLKGVNVYLRKSLI